MKVYLRNIFIGVFLLGIAGCSTGASMRIEVEVYKGPLSRPYAA